MVSIQIQRQPDIGKSTIAGIAKGIHEVLTAVCLIIIAMHGIIVVFKSAVTIIGKCIRIIALL